MSPFTRTAVVCPSGAIARPEGMVCSASLLIVQGVDVQVVSRQLRHSSVTVTLYTYGHLFPQQRDSAVERMDSLMGIG